MASTSVVSLRCMACAMLSQRVRVAGSCVRSSAHAAFSGLNAGVTALASASVV
jgi:hypothetical protein